jgi:UrcA family protein
MIPPIRVCTRRGTILPARNVPFLQLIPETTMKTATTTYRLPTIIATILCGASALGLTTMPAVADSFAPPLQLTVKFADLDISRTEGATVLYGRIRAAAKNVCAPFDRGGALDKIAFASCIQKSIADAVTAVNAPALTAVYSAKTRFALPVRVASLQSR